MSFLDDVKMYTRFIWGLRAFLSRTISLEEAKAIIRQRMAEREKNFLRLVERGIFNYPKSPYLSLLKLAQCEMNDIENMVRSSGLENTLRSLREAGVYVSFEEFKGREPFVRNGKLIPIRARDFDNPFLSHYYHSKTGGTTGAGTRVATDLDHLADQTSRMMLAYDAHGVFDTPTAFWYGILPDQTGINNMLRHALSGRVAKKWFSPITEQDYKPSLKNRLATRYIIAMARWVGVPIPQPESIPLDQAVIIARWAAKTIETYGACLIRTHISMAVRISIAAREEGLNLAGATFMGGGEPPTPAKVAQITSLGARWIPTYFFTEVGAVGIGCANPLDENDLHFFKDSLALIQYPIQVPGSEFVVDAFSFTTLLPSAPKIMLNVEIDDYGIIESRSCGCPLESCGFTEHLRDVRSFSKLTGEGVTLFGSEMVHILEEVLPARFGGSPLDYQALEEEDGQGFTRLSVLVSPSVGVVDEKAVIEAILEALSRSSVASDLARANWCRAKTLRVKRQQPVWTARGKLMPLHLSQRSRRLAGALRGPGPNPQEKEKLKD
jgi:hypothetical protein